MVVSSFQVAGESSGFRSSAHTDYILPFTVRWIGEGFVMTDLSLFVAIGSFFEGLVRFASWVLGVSVLRSIYLDLLYDEAPFPEEVHSGKKLYGAGSDDACYLYHNCYIVYNWYWTDLFFLILSRKKKPSLWRGFQTF